MSAKDITALLDELSPAGLASVEAFARQVRDLERRGVQPLSGLAREDFAARVQAAANSSRNAWPTSGSDKVFVSVLFAELAASGATVGIDLDAFKACLLEAHRARLLSLSRCDLVEAASAADVEASVIRYLSAEFHVVMRART
ncbi:hypothetical protein [Polyangium fumosum]|uniref:Uncharacterized protein n=1 Tax=Polyangium fumosum TaxID=889272 RepID=A0A4U1ILH5_9BACT|nr:hypothetical protein [Polyangium fumosum]TKC94593.1 hypothetical protein E8A74_48390 [Polyangium fumosum]